MKLQIALALGEEMSSPLYDRVVIGENSKTSTRCITIETIKIGLDRSNFFGSFVKNSIKVDGSFYKGNNDDTFDLLVPVLEGCLLYVKENLQYEWKKGEAEDGFLSINAGIESLIRLISDIVDHLIDNGTLNPKSEKPERIIEEIKYYIDPVITYFAGINHDQKAEFKVFRRFLGTAF